MKNVLIGFFFFIIWTLNQACSDNHKQQLSSIRIAPSYHKIDFTSFINKQKNDSLQFYEALLNNKTFVNILEHSEYYKDDVTSFLNKGDYNNLQVAICVCAMQNLGVDDYVKLCDLVLSLYDNNKVPELILEHAIDPDFLHKRIIVNNYRNPAVIKLIESLESNQKVSDDFKAGLPDILSGKSSKELKQFDKDNRAN